MKCIISAKSFYKLQQDFKVQDKASPLWAGGPVDPAVHMLSKWMEKPLLAYSVDELKHSINAECWLTKLNSSKEENLQLPFLSVEKSVFPSRAFLKTFKLKLMRLKCHQLITNWVSRARHTAAFRTDVWNSGLLSQKHLSAVSCGLILSFFFPPVFSNDESTIFWIITLASVLLKGTFEREVGFAEKKELFCFSQL